MIDHSFQLLWEWLVHLFCLKDLISYEACSYLGLIDFPRVIMLSWTVKVFNMSRLRIIHRCSQLKMTSSTLSLPLFCSILDVELYPAVFSSFHIILSPKGKVVHTILWSPLCDPLLCEKQDGVPISKALLFFLFFLSMISEESSCIRNLTTHSPLKKSRRDFSLDWISHLFSISPCWTKKEKPSTNDVSVLIHINLIHININPLFCCGDIVRFSVFTNRIVQKLKDIWFSSESWSFSNLTQLSINCNTHESQLCLVSFLFRKVSAPPLSC